MKLSDFNQKVNCAVCTQPVIKVEWEDNGNDSRPVHKRLVDFLEFNALPEAARVGVLYAGEVRVCESCQAKPNWEKKARRRAVLLVRSEVQQKRKQNVELLAEVLAEKTHLNSLLHDYDKFLRGFK